MSGVSGVVGKIAGVVSIAAFALSTAGVGAVAGIALKSVATYAALAATAANVGAQLTATAPPRQGSVASTTIGTDQPSPWLVGRTYYGGARVHIAGYGATLKKVKNPYLIAADVYSVGGPVDALEGIYADMAFIPMRAEAPVAGTNGYFYEHIWRSFQLGAQAETSALPLRFPGAPGWGSNALLSGKAAIAYNALFDKDGEVFASGLAQLGAVWRGAKCWNPVADSTYPGGSGASRWAAPGDTAAHDTARGTWAFTRSPGLLALRYALGIWERDPRVSGSRYRKTFGAGIPLDGLIVEQFVHLHNVCTANGWNCDGVLFEPSSSKWDNLKRILAAGGAEPCWVGGRLGVRVNAPRIALDTIRDDDIAEGEVVVGAMQGWEQRLNTIVPKYRSEAHRWEYVSTQPVQIATYLAEDGEEKREERQYDLVQDPTQARQLAAYELLDRRELGEIELPCKPRMRRYGPGDLLNIDLPALGLVNQPAVVLRRSLDPATMGVTLVLRGETLAKHEFALGRTGTPPPTPALVTTGTRDEAAFPVTLVDMGPWDLATTYREGHVVQDQGSSWVYINTTASAGNPPPSLPATENAYWRVLARAGVDGADAPLVVTEWSVDGVSGWHPTFTEGDKYQRQSNDNGATWGPPVRVVGESAGSGADGVSPSIIFRRSATIPGTPAQDTGNPPPGWQDGPYGTEADGFLWQATSKFRGAMQLQPWSAPVRITGPAGANGASAFKLIAINNVVFPTPDSINKVTGGTNGWDGKAYTEGSSSGGAVISATVLPGTFIGLTTDPTVNDSYTSIDYGLHLSTDGGVYGVYRNGPAVWLSRDNGRPSLGLGPQRLIINSDGKTVRYSIQGVGEFFSHPVNTVGERIYGVFALVTRGTLIYDIAFQPGGAVGRDGLDGKNGLDGTNGQSIHIAFADSADGTVNFTTGDVGARTFIGVYTDTNPGADSTNPAAYGWTRLRGIDGTNGLAGPGGYVHIAYSDSVDGSINFHLSDPTGRRYLGTYTDQTEPDSNNPASYSWSLIKGADGSDGVSPIAVTLQPNAVTFQAYANGAPYAGQFPYNVGVSATRAGTVIPVTSVGIVSTNGMNVATNPLRITAMTSTDGYAVLDVTAAGQTVRVQLSASIVREGSDGSVATRLAINAPQLTWTDFAQHGNSVAINASATGKLTVNLSGQMTGDPAADYVLRFVSKVQYRPAGGSWIDVPGSQATSTEGGISTIGDGPGSGTRIVRANVNGTGPYAITGLTADGPYEVRVLTYRLTQFGSSAVGLSLYAERTV